jgi:hypothetical protein
MFKQYSTLRAARCATITLFLLPGPESFLFPAAAKAGTDNKPVTAALKRCAVQNQLQPARMPR